MCGWWLQNAVSLLGGDVVAAVLKLQGDARVEGGRVGGCGWKCGGVGMGGWDGGLGGCLGGGWGAGMRCQKRRGPQGCTPSLPHPLPPTARHCQHTKQLPSRSHTTTTTHKGSNSPS